MNTLSKINKSFHEKRPYTPPDKKLTLWQPSDDFMHCCIESRGCRFSRDYGACIMCDYGMGVNLKPDELKSALETELQPYMGTLTRLLVGSYGSIFDTSEVSEECFEVLLDFISKQKIRTVIFETHCCTISEDILHKIQDKLLPEHNVIIEMGYESCDPFVLRECLNKILDLRQLCTAIELIHSFSMEVSLNVFLGAPFMNTRAELDTALESVEWAFGNGADSVVIFPCNIKPFTAIHALYKNGIYKGISQWLLVELLSRIPEKYLGAVSLSWYGDRKNFYENDEYPLIPPGDCVQCHEKLFEFYGRFIKEKLSENRKELIATLVSSVECKCYNRIKDELSQPAEILTKEEICCLVKEMAKVDRINVK